MYMHIQHTPQKAVDDLVRLVMYSNPSINTVNGSCMFAVLIESMLIKVKNKGD